MGLRGVTLERSDLSGPLYSRRVANCSVNAGLNCGQGLDPDVSIDGEGGVDLCCPESAMGEITEKAA